MFCDCAEQCTPPEPARCENGHEIDPEYGSCLLCGDEAYLSGFRSIARTAAWIEDGHREHFASGADFILSVAKCTVNHDYDRGRRDAALSARGL